MDVYMFHCSESVSINVSASSSTSISASVSVSASTSINASANANASAKCVGNEPSRCVVSTPGWPRSSRVPQGDTPRPVIQNLIEKLIAGKNGFGSLE